MSDAFNHHLQQTSDNKSCIEKKYVVYKYQFGR